MQARRTDKRSGNPSELPSGTVTLCLTDIEGSTQLLRKLSDLYADVLERHRSLLREVSEQHGGFEIDSHGDAFFAVFARSRDAVRAAIGIQRALADEEWPSGAEVRVRIGLHTGEPKLADGKYFGMDVHRTARISAAASGGQVLMSAVTRGLLIDDELPEGASIRDLGSHRLRDMRYPELLFDLSIPGLPTEFKPVRSLATQPNNLPIAPTTFVGRDKEVKRICDTLRHKATRLLTLTGPGGTGKTRLSLAVAEELLDEYPDGVFQVTLAAVTDPSLVAPTIAQTLAITEVASRTPLESLKHRLGNTRTLLILDNFEQVVEATNVVLELFESCPKIQFLITSREALNVRIEHEHAVAPLELPPVGAGANLAALEKVESIRLFTDRIQDFQEDFSLTPENAAAISEICIRLDGLPLALELAASRLKVLTPQALISNLANSLKFLKSGRRDVEDRQRTLRHTIEWSYNLLDPVEQRLLQQVSVFAGGFSISSAEAICADQESMTDIFELLTSLVRKSLLIQYSADGEPRLRMLNTIREFGFDTLQSDGQQRDVCSKHAEHYLNLAEALAPDLLGRGQRQCVSRLLTEADNIRAALAWTIQERDLNRTSRFLNALRWLWIPRGLLTEGKAWASRALETFEKHESTRDTTVVIESAGWLDIFSGDYASALPKFERGLEIFQELADESDIARSKMTLGITCLDLEDPRGAGLSDEALALYRRLSDSNGVGMALIVVGLKHHLSGQNGPASACYEESVSILSELGNMFSFGQVLANLAHIRLNEGNWHGAANLLVEALQIGREYDYPMMINWALAGLGGVAMLRQDPAEATRMFGAVEASLAALGVSLEPPDEEVKKHYMDLARSALPDGSFDEAFQQGADWTEQELFAAAVSLRNQPI